MFLRYGIYLDVSTNITIMNLIKSKISKDLVS